MNSKKLSQHFFAKDACCLARDLLGKVLMVFSHSLWLQARIIETEAYYLEDKASHASLGFTEKRRALFMPAGTIYMYYARGGDSLNISANGAGNAVLIKSAYPVLNQPDSTKMLQVMQTLNPLKSHDTSRPIHRLCNGQTLLCKSLDLRVPDWDAQVFDKKRFFVADQGFKVSQIIQTSRLGIPAGRDEDLAYRFIDYDYVQYCTNNPLTKRSRQPKVRIDKV